MSRKTIIGLVAAFVVVAALGVGAIVFLLNSGYVTVVSNLSSGQTDDSIQRPVGYVGNIVPKGTNGSVPESGLDKEGAPLVVIPGGTKVKVIAAKEDDAQVEILEGRERGMKVWIYWTDLR